MTATELYIRVAATLHTVSIPGVSRAEVDRFLERHRPHLLRHIQQQYDELCRLGRLVPDFQRDLGQVRVTALDVGSTTATWAAQFGSGPAKLAVKARCHPGNPELREYAVHLYSDRLRRWLVFPEQTWVWSEDEAIQRLVDDHFPRMRWRESESPVGTWEGASGAPFELSDATAIGFARGWDPTQPLTAEDLAELERARHERWDRHYRAWANGQHGPSAAVPPAAATPIPEPRTEAVPSLVVASSGASGETDASATISPATLSTVVDVPASSATPSSREVSSGDSTLWGGRRGEKLDPATVREGLRVVTDEGLHGTVLKITELSSIVVGPGVTHQRQTRIVFDVRLDSGRTLLGQRELYAELARPAAVIPDVSFDDGRSYFEPLVAWREVKREFDHIGYYEQKGASARKPANKREYERLARASREAFLRKFDLFRRWRQQHPSVVLAESGTDQNRADPIAASREFSGLAYRIMELESGADAPRWPGELRLLKTIPKDYASRFKPGDSVFAYTADAQGHWSHERHRIASIEGDEAVLEDGRRTPPYYLRLDSSSSVELPAYTEPQYLVDLAGAILADAGSRYPARGAVARAVKEFLTRHGIDVRTRVSSGSMVTGIDLHPGAGRWTPAEVQRMNGLLGNLGARSDGASFEPWQREGREYSPYDDYPPKGSGLVIAAEHIPTFAPILASALKDAGQSLNRAGEAWLARARGKGDAPGSTAVSGAAHPRGGATDEHRAASATGCREDAFHLDGFGHIRVVCGQTGRRDQWNNVWVNSRRFGFNGERWARGEVPPAAVLAAIRSRGITAFEAGIQEALRGPVHEPEIVVQKDTLEYLCSCIRGSAQETTRAATETVR